MSDQAQDTPEEEEEQLAPFMIEPARSNRSKCKTCRRKIDKDTLRIGIMIEGPFGAGYLWHHLNCAAKRNFPAVEEAYSEKCWDDSVKVPPLEELKKLEEQATKKKSEKIDPPYAQVAPSGRAKCKHCDETIEKGSVRIVLGREVEFYRQVRVALINVHPKCVAAELLAEDCGTESEGFADALRNNTKNVSTELVDAALAEIGSLA